MNIDDFCSGKIFRFKPMVAISNEPEHRNFRFVPNYMCNDRGQCPEQVFLDRIVFCG